MINEFASVGGGQAFFQFTQEPFVVIHEAFHGFHHQRLAVAPLLGGNAGEFFLQIWVESQFHEISLGA